MKQPIIFLLALAALCQSCFRSAEPKYPSTVLDVPNERELDAVIFETHARVINDQNEIVGYTSSSQPTNRNLDYPIDAFRILPDGTGYVSLSVPQAYATWAMDINDQGLVAGAYRLATDEPAHAMAIMSDGTGFQDLHPAFAYASVATHVTPQGQILGFVVDDNDVEEAVIFDVETESVAYLMPQGTGFSKVEVVNSSLAILRFTPTNATLSQLWQYNFADGSTERLNFPLVEEDMLFVEWINEDNEVLGWYLDLTDFSEQGYQYTLGEAEARLYNTAIREGGSNYVWFRFLGQTADGKIAGVASRENGAGLPQARGFVFEADYTGFEDITPDNRGAYGEVYDVNANGWIVGYAGFANPAATLYNRAFALQR